jgi:hypothetical protein
MSRTHDTDLAGRTPMDPHPTPQQRRAQLRIARALGDIGFALPGTITERMMRCGKRACRCKADPPQLHGPYIQWTRTVEGKTVTKLLTAEQLARYQPWFDNARQLRALANELEKLSIEAIISAEQWGR